MSQTNYSINQAAAMLGMLADSRVKHTESMICSENMPIGRGAVKVVGEDDQVQLPDATDYILFGVVQHSHALEGGLPGGTTPVQYPTNKPANILRKGAIYVHFETAFDPDTDTLYVRTGAGGAGEEPGQFLNTGTPASGTAAAVTGDIAVRTTLAAAGLGILELNLP